MFVKVDVLNEGQQWVGVMHVVRIRPNRTGKAILHLVGGQALETTMPVDDVMDLVRNAFNQDEPREMTQADALEGMAANALAGRQD